MKRWWWLVTAVAMSAAAGCSFEPTTCAEAACDAAREYCVLYGSDTLAPSTAGCHALPAACTGERSCDCLQRETPDLEFCFEAGGCSAPADDALAVVCPGG
ncbi:MAG: hypothetical protein ABIJ09_22655 [Pseudomonadota bacterium]